MGGNTACTSTGGGCGTIFKITPAGVLTTLHYFDAVDGANPVAGLVLASDGNFYGTTSFGGLGACSGRGPYACGTIFRITPEGVLTTIHIFGGVDGAFPNGLVQATDGNLYGTTSQGGAPGGLGYGSIFKISLDGTFTSLYNFRPAVGYYPYAGLLQGTDGNFYGTTSKGPYVSSTSHGYGAIFKFSVGLGPFVKTLPGAGAVGSHVRILGDDLTGATSVTFNGIAAQFSVLSQTQIVATVPAGATTGKVEVITPSGTLLSNVKFLVP